MHAKTSKRLVLVLALIASPALTQILEAQDKAKFVEAQKQNAAALRQYTWQSRTELKLKGESKNVKLEQVRHDVDGKLQKTPLGGTPAPQKSEPQPTGGRRGARVKQKIEDHRE